MFKAGNYQSQGSYKAFIPEKVNQNIELKDPRIPLLLAEAMRYLGELNAYSQLVPDIDFFIKMHVAKEATISSRIEGTRTDIEDAVKSKEEIGPEDRDDWEEVQNYIKAINYAVGRLKDLPLSLRLVNETHQILLSGVRGYSKTPGEIRKSQNWISGSGIDINTAAFVPPPAPLVPELLSDLQNFWHNKDLLIPDLVRIAITHYQFETIHPYLDGNGRIGRLLITLQLVDSKILKVPALYFSDYLEHNRSSYFDSLDRVRQSNDIEQWVRFFLSGVAETAKDAKDTLSKVVELRADYIDRIEKGIGIRRTANAKALLPHLFAKPIVSVNDVEKTLGVVGQTANVLVDDLVKISLLSEVTGKQKNRIFVLNEYLDLFKDQKRRAND
jgi:Fic family protein